MWNNFFKHIDIDPNNAHILDGNAPDLQAECDAFEKKIEEAGGIDLFVGGMKKCSMVSCDSEQIHWLWNCCSHYLPDLLFSIMM